MIIPIIVLIIILYSLYKKVDIYNEFIGGAKESINLSFSLFPSMLAMILGVNIFLKCGILEDLIKIIKINFPIEILPMMITRSISGSSTLAILNNILAKYGPDSKIGILASIIQGTTETTLYVITIYYSVVGIKKIRYSLFIGLLADFISIVVCLIVMGLIS